MALDWERPGCAERTIAHAKDCIGQRAQFHAPVEPAVTLVALPRNRAPDPDLELAERSRAVSPKDCARLVDLKLATLDDALTSDHGRHSESAILVE